MLYAAFAVRQEVRMKVFVLGLQFVDAIEQWVKMGGTLILSSGSDSGQLLGEGGPLARFAPPEGVGRV